jgi:hypothetical protein
VDDIGVYPDGRSLDRLIDLWIEEEGNSDLVLQVHVREMDSESLVTVYMVGLGLSWASLIVYPQSCVA